MINGGDGAQNKWQASPPPGNNNNNFMICLSHSLTLSHPAPLALSDQLC